MDVGGGGSEEAGRSCLAPALHNWPELSWVVGCPLFMFFVVCKVRLGAPCASNSHPPNINPRSDHPPTHSSCSLQLQCFCNKCSSTFAPSTFAPSTFALSYSSHYPTHLCLQCSTSATTARVHVPTLNINRTHPPLPACSSSATVTSAGMRWTSAAWRMDESCSSPTPGGA